MLAAEQDSLKQELSIFMDQMEHLERDKAAMAEELKEMKDLEEFNALEEDFRKEQEVTVTGADITFGSDCRSVMKFV